MAQSFSIPGVGDVVADRYRVDAVIGKGGFGVVFRATQIGMERQVALKTLLPSAMVQDDMVERFRREAILARNLNHPNTIRLYDFGQTDGGLLYIAMEYLDGLTLRKLLRKEGPMPPARVKNIGLQLLKSLAEAHQHDIVHRDLKPGNIIIGDVVGESDFVKVLDFGIAKMMNAGSEEEQKRQLTQTGTSFGTPNYMAPEQVRSKGIGPCTDLYAVGLLLSECLTGTPVYKGESPMDIAVQQLSPEPPPIPDWVLRGPLGPVIQRATQKEIALRYPSAVEMLRDLKSVDPHASLDISASIDANRAQELAESQHVPAYRKPVLIGLAAVIAVLLLVGAAMLGSILGQQHKEDAETSNPPPAPVQASAESPEKPPTKPSKEPPTDLSAVATPPTNPQDQPDDEVQKPELVDVALRTTPKGATVWDGETSLGETPVDLKFTRSERSKTLVLKLDGYYDEVLDVALSETSEHRVPLRAQEKPSHVENLQSPPTSSTRKTPEPNKIAKRPPTRRTPTRRPTAKTGSKTAAKQPTTTPKTTPKTTNTPKKTPAKSGVFVPSID